MLHYDGIDISKVIHLPKCNKSKECMICHYLFCFSIMDSNFKIPNAMVVMI